MTRVAILSWILLLSGIVSLIFETLWLRLSGLTFGNWVWSADLILSSFMAGLALGNAIAASSKIRQWRPLHLYAVLEMAVALFGCTIVFGLPLLGGWIRPVFQTLWSYQPILTGLRLVLSFFILLLPTTAMGLTLPVLIEDPILRRTDFGRAIGLLYGFNTLGAVAGALLGEAYLVEAFGLRGTALAAGLASCIAAAIALLIAKIDGAIPELNLTEGALPLRLEIRYQPPWRLLFVSLGTGAILLCLEVVWFRFLRLYVASFPTAFSVMLAVVLAGIGLGSIVSGTIHRGVARLSKLLPVLLLLAGITTLLSYLFFPGAAVRPSAGPFNLDSWREIGLLSFALMFPVSLLSGILFPAIVARVQISVGDRMNSTGLTTLFNTIGAATGPLLASFVLLPTIGFQWSLILCAAGYALLALLVSERSSWSFRCPLGWIIAGLGGVLIIIIGIFPYHRDQTHFSHASLPYEVDEQGHVLAHVVKRMEGISDTYQLLERDLFGEPYYYRLLTNAFSMSATIPPGQRYMRLFAYLPLAFLPDSQDVLLICYGCGVTADAFDREWIMMGIKGPGRSVKEEEIRRLWSEPTTGADLRRIGIEFPQQLAALFLMDSDEIERATKGIAPLTDIYPKRLSDQRWDEQASHDFASSYMAASAALHRFLQSPLMNKIWPETLTKSLESYFVIRETRYLSGTIGSNGLAELDLYLRHSRLRTPVLEVLHSDQFS